MPITTSTTISLVLHEDDLHVAQVTIGPMGGRARHLATVPGIASAHPEQVRAALAGVPRRGRLILTLPSSMCAVRPIAITSAMWSSAREEIEATATRLMPFDAGDAMIGVIDRLPQRDQDSAQRSGYLVAASRSGIAPIIDAIETALSRPIDRVQTIHHALLGLGLQRQPIAEVIERVGGTNLRHRLRFGLPEALGEPMLGAPAPGASALPGAPASADGRELTITEVAAAAALSPVVAAGASRPLLGGSPPRSARWLVPALITAAALALALVAVGADRARWNEAEQQVQAQRDAQAQALAEVQALRARVESLNARLIRVNQITADWQAVLPGLAAARRVLPQDAIFYQVGLSADAVTIRGEAPRASDVIQRLEASPAFIAAEQVGPTVRVDERDTEQFDLRARRERTPIGREATP